MRENGRETRKKRKRRREKQSLHCHVIRCQPHVSLHIVHIVRTSAYRKKREKAVVVFDSHPARIRQEPGEDGGKEEKEEEKKKGGKKRDCERCMTPLTGFVCETLCGFFSGLIFCFLFLALRINKCAFITKTSTIRDSETRNA